MAIIDLKCKNGCIGILGRGHLEGASVYEGKCRHCNEWTTFRAVQVATEQRPDGQGGYLTVPVGADRL